LKYYFQKGLLVGPEVRDTQSPSSQTVYVHLFTQYLLYLCFAARHVGEGGGGMLRKKKQNTKMLCTLSLSLSWLHHRSMAWPNRAILGLSFWHAKASSELRLCTYI
jgi:hypothetical protein